MTFFSFDQYHSVDAFANGGFSDLDWRAYFASSALGDFFHRLWYFDRNDSPPEKEFSLPVPFSTRDFSPITCTAATPFDCEASASFAQRIFSSASTAQRASPLVLDNPHVAGTTMSTMRRPLLQSTPDACNRAYTDRHFPVHAFGTFTRSSIHNFSFTFEMTPDSSTPGQAQRPNHPPVSPPRPPTVPPTPVQPPPQPPQPSPPAQPPPPEAIATSEFLGEISEPYREPSKEKREATNIQRCLELLSKGQTGKGARAPLSKGSSNPHDPSIREQLQKKHPLRKEEIPAPTDEQLNHQTRTPNFAQNSSQRTFKHPLQPDRGGFVTNISNAWLFRNMEVSLRRLFKQNIIYSTFRNTSLHQIIHYTSTRFG